MQSWLWATAAATGVDTRHHMPIDGAVSKKVAVAGLTTLALLTAGLCSAMFAGPSSLALEDPTRILFYELPSLWIAIACFAVNFVASAVYLRRPAVSADSLAAAAAQVGILFCTTGIATGMMLARAETGRWFTWEAHLATMLILWPIYIAYLMLRFLAHVGQSSLLSAVLAIFAFADIPIAYAAMWWRSAGFRVPQHSYAVLGWNVAGFASFAAILISFRYRLAMLRAHLDEMHAMRAPGIGPNA